MKLSYRLSHRQPHQILGVLTVLLCFVSVLFISSPVIASPADRIYTQTDGCTRELMYVYGGGASIVPSRSNLCRLIPGGNGGCEINPGAVVNPWNVGFRGQHTATMCTNIAIFHLQA